VIGLPPSIDARIPGRPASFALMIRRSTMHHVRNSVANVAARLCGDVNVEDSIVRVRGSKLYCVEEFRRCVEKRQEGNARPAELSHECRIRLWCWS
jgi:hypothetical protein